MISGCLIGESMRTGAVFDPTGLRIVRITRLDQSTAAGPGQPSVWTAVEFETDDDDLQALADRIAACLRTEGGWYCDLTSADEKVVAFAGRVFRYRRGDPAGRAEAVAYGRAAGVPEHQLDWRE